MLKEASEITSRPLFSEIRDAKSVSMRENKGEVVQIGARKKQNVKRVEAGGE